MEILMRKVQNLLKHKFEFYMVCNNSADGGAGLQVPNKQKEKNIYTAIIVIGFLLPSFGHAASLEYLQENSSNFVAKIEDTYGEMIDVASLLHDYDRDMILAVIVVESEGKVTAVSSKGAKGLMQLMPRTAKAMGAKDPHDPLQNILAGTKYLKELERTYGFDSREEALLAYNMGPSRAKRWLSQYDPEDFGYVRKVMYVYRLLHEEENNKRNLANLSSDEGMTVANARHILTRPQVLSSVLSPAALPNFRRDVAVETN